jgi:hypothetical protein
MDKSMSDPFPFGPKIGDIIYVDDIDIMAGAWIRGGKATVSRVSSDAPTTDVEVSEVAGAVWNWQELAAQQTALEVRYGETVAGQKMIGSREW